MQTANHPQPSILPTVSSNCQSPPSKRVWQKQGRAPRRQMPPSQSVRVQRKVHYIPREPFFFFRSRWHLSVSPFPFFFPSFPFPSFPDSFLLFAFASPCNSEHSSNKHRPGATTFGERIACQRQRVSVCCCIVRFLSSRMAICTIQYFPCPMAGDPVMRKPGRHRSRLIHHLTRHNETDAKEKSKSN